MASRSIIGDRSLLKIKRDGSTEILRKLRSSKQYIFGSNMQGYHLMLVSARCSGHNAWQWDLVFALGMTSGFAITTFEGKLTEFDTLATWFTSFGFDNCFLAPHMWSLCGLANSNSHSCW